MKVKHFLALFLFSTVLTFLGALAKLESWAFASQLLIAGMLLGALAVLLFVWKLLSTKKFKEFLNS